VKVLKSMVTEISPRADSVSLWGVLHGGRLVRVSTDRAHKSVAFDFVVDEFNSFLKWKLGSAIRIELNGVHGVRAEQWKPEPDHGDGVIRSRRGFSIDWRNLEHKLPPIWIEVSEATADFGDREANFRVSGLKHGDQFASNDLIELSVLAERLTIFTPDGQTEVDRLLQQGDSFWDYLTKRKTS
jgi:hypothetical protein